jgi:uncharacterized protein (UPF0548 family)
VLGATECIVAAQRLAVLSAFLRSAKSGTLRVAEREPVRERRTLSQRQLTYDAVGITVARGAMSVPAGYRGYEKTATIGDGLARWEFASDAVLQWAVKTRSGFTVVADRPSDRGPQVICNQRYWLTAHFGLFGIREPIEVVAVIDERDRKGFAYGTLSGHPVSGEEAFIVQRQPDGSVSLTIRSATQPTTGAWRAAAPAVAFVQRCYRRRYLRALTGVN